MLDAPLSPQAGFNGSQPVPQNAEYGDNANFSSVDLGTTPQSSDLIVICLWNNNINGSSQSITNVAYGSTAASFLAYCGGDYGVQMWTATGVTANDQTLAFTANYGMQWVTPMVGVLRGLSSQTPTATAQCTAGYYADPQQFSAPLSVPANGFGMMFFSGGNNTAPTSSSGYTQDAGESGQGYVVLGHTFNNTASPVSWNPQINGYSYAFTRMVGAAWH